MAEIVTIAKLTLRCRQHNRLVGNDGRNSDNCEMNTETLTIQPRRDFLLGAVHQIWPFDFLMVFVLLLVNEVTLFVFTNIFFCMVYIKI